MRNILAGKQISYQRLHVQPTPFNTLMWRVVGMTDDGYFEGFWSLIRPGKGLSLEYYEDRSDLLSGIEDMPSVQRLQWFTKGFYRVGLENRRIVLADLRMGVEPDYVFAFEVAELGNPHPRPLLPERVATEYDLGRFTELWERM